MGPHPRVGRNSSSSSLVVTSTPTTTLLRHEMGCLLLPSSSSPLMGTGKLSNTGQELVKLLKRVGFEVEIYDSQWNNKFLVAVIFLGKPMLRKYATELGLPIRANSRALREIIIGYSRSDRESTNNVMFQDEGFPDKSLERVFLPYDERLDSDFHLYNKGSDVPGGVGALVECNRQVVAENVLESHLNMSLLKGGGVVIDCFPPHDEKKQIKLWYYYTNTSLWHVNPFVEMHTTPQILALRDYVGKDTALYAVFGQSLAYVHLPILVAGVVLDLFSPRPDDGSWLTLGRAMCGLLMPLLGLLSLRLWERKESQIASDWGCHSPAALALSLPLSHSPFIRSHTSGAETIVDSFDLPPASTLPLLAAERTWWTDKVLLSFLGTQECREGQDLTQDVLWPVPLKGTLILPSLLRSRLLLVRALFTTLAVLVASLTLQLPVLYTVRVVVSSLTRGMVDTEVLTFLMPLLAVAVLYMAISTPAMALLRAVTVRETWRTHREYSRTLLARELGFKLCVWAGPALWALFQQYTEGSCKSHNGSCASAAGATATTMLVLHSLVEVALLFALPALRVRKRLDALKLNEHHAKSIRMPLSGGIRGADDCWGEDQGQGHTPIGLEEMGRGYGGRSDRTPRSKGAPSENSSRELAAAAEREFLTLSSAFRPDRDVDDLSHLSATYQQLVGALVRWTIAWSFFGVAPWTLFIATLHSSLDVFLVAYQLVFNHRRSFSPATQLLAINPDAQRLLRALCVASALASAAIFTVYRDGTHGASELVSELTPFSSSSSSSSSFQEMHTGAVVFFLYSWVLVLVLYGLEVLLPPVPDTVILSSLRNEHIWRDLQSKLFFQAKGGPHHQGPGVPSRASTQSGAGAGAGAGDEKSRYRGFNLQSMSSTTPGGSYSEMVSLARHEDDFGRPIRGNTPGSRSLDPRITEALLADRAGELEQEQNLYRQAPGEARQSPGKSQNRPRTHSGDGEEEDVEAGGASPSSLSSQSMNSASRSAGWRKRATSATVYEELQESDSDEA